MKSGMERSSPATLIVVTREKSKVPGRRKSGSKSVSVESTDPQAETGEFPTRRQLRTAGEAPLLQLRPPCDVRPSFPDTVQLTRSGMSSWVSAETAGPMSAEFP